MGQHALEMAPRAEQIAQVILRRTDHSLADQAIVRVGPLRRQSIEPSSQAQSDALLTAGDAKGPQAPERAQLVLGVAETLRNLEGLCPDRADLGNGTSGIHQRCRKRARGAASRGARPAPAPAAIAASACSTRPLHSSISDKCIHKGTAAAVSATPIEASPPGEKAQSSAARTLSILGT